MDDKLKRAIDRRMAGAALPEASRARILQAAAHGKGRNVMKAKRKAILVMAAALLLISGCVGAALYHDLARQTMDDWEQEHNSTPLGLSQSFDGYTITLDEILPLGQEVTLEDGKVVYLEALYFEPLDVCLDYRILSEDDRIHPEICLQLKNGERLAAWRIGGSDDGITCYFESFNRGMGHIGIDDVQSLIIGGVIVPIAE